jgi:hypothetical protein|tara:strand:- start:278 stop:556 length:279 start_codon:yes stop_codon:yes gene_type:complete
MKRKTAKKKETIKILGKDYKVDETIANTIKSLADALHSHEVALLTWVHKSYKKRKTKEKTQFEEALNAYVLRIPEAEKILKNMKEHDEGLKK